MIASAESYLSKVESTPKEGEASGAEKGYATALEHAFVTWGALQSELDRLLRKRIETLHDLPDYVRRLEALYTALIGGDGLPETQRSEAAARMHTVRAPEPSCVPGVPCGA